MRIKTLKALMKSLEDSWARPRFPESLQTYDIKQSHSSLFKVYCDI